MCLPGWWAGRRGFMYNRPQTLDLWILWTLYIFSLSLSTDSSKPKTWYDTLSQLLLEDHLVSCVIDKTLYSLMLKGYLILEYVNVDNIIYGSTNESLCKIRFAKLMQVGTWWAWWKSWNSFWFTCNSKEWWQSKDVQDLLKVYTLEESRLAKTRTSTATKLDQDKIGKMSRSQASLVW